MIGPLVFDENEVRIIIGFDLINRGRSPATNVQLFTDLCADLLEAQTKGEKAATFPPYAMPDLGVILFPDEQSAPRDIPLSMPIANFKANIADVLELLRASNPNAHDEVARPAIMACATYRLPGDLKPHHTVILLEVVHRDAVHRGWDGNADKIDLAYLKLRQNFLGGQIS